jgi:threonine/homoserine/homoserine lactone efflux protein
MHHIHRVDELALGIALGLGAGLAPGPLLALVVSATLERGFAAGARVAAAPLITDAPIVALCVLVLDGLPAAVVDGLTVAGGAFVIWLGIDALRGGGAEAASRGGDVRRGVLVNALSPHPWLFWLGAGGPLLLRAGEQSAWAAAAFLAGFYALLVGAKVAVAAAIAPGRHRLRAGAPRISAALLIATGAAIIGTAVGRW